MFVHICPDSQLNWATPVRFSVANSCMTFSRASNGMIFTVVAKEEYVSLTYFVFSHAC